MKKVTFILIGLVILNNLIGQKDSKIKIFDKESNVLGFAVNDYVRFNPNEIDFAIADSLAKIYVIQNSSKLTYDRTPIDNYQDYYKQVYGLIDKNGDKVILLNCFLSAESHVYWKDKTVAVKGGGKRYFSIKINLTNYKIFDFLINAPA